MTKHARYYWGLIALVLLLDCLFDERIDIDRKLQQTGAQTAIIPRPYSQKEISETAPHLKNHHPRLLIFNGTNFEVYNLNYKDQHYFRQDPAPKRSGRIIPLLVHALKDINPSRFQPGSPVFQLLFKDSDYVESDCFNTGACPVQDFAPLLMFGSVPLNETEMPTVKAFPNWFFVSCLYEYKLRGQKHCEWTEHADSSSALDWQDLEPTVVWRGSDFAFLHQMEEFRFAGAKSIDLTNTSTPQEVVDTLLSHWNDLTPRWRGAALSAQAQVQQNSCTECIKSSSTPWIDAQFVGTFGVEAQNEFTQRGVPVAASERMEPSAMARYKYLIDFGGGGGTSWRGGMTKLGFPGALFHHVTPTQDWYFPQMRPWVHYIPVACNVSDLREKYEWAEAHPSQTKAIASASTGLYHYLMGEQYMGKVYQELFVDYLKNLLEAYVPSPLLSWEDAKQQYEQDGFEIHRVAYCDDVVCRIPGTRHEESMVDR